MYKKCDAVTDSAPVCAQSPIGLKKCDVVTVQYLADHILVENISLRYRKAQICDGVTTTAGSYGHAYRINFVTSSHIPCCQVYFVTYHLK